MQTQRVAIDPQGAIVSGYVGLAAGNVQVLRNAGQPVPEPVFLRAMIDTGAQVTCVDPQVLAPLLAVGLKPARIVLANLPATIGLNATTEYFVSLTLAHPSGHPRSNLVLRNQPVIEQPLALLGYEALIGRDVLERSLLVYDGPGRSFTLAF